MEASTVRRCERCGTQLSRYNNESICAPCRPALAFEQGTVPTPRLSHSLAAGHPPTPTWLWVSPATQAAVASGDLAAILAAYRRANRLSQAELAAIIGLDQPYVSRIERGARKIRDIRTLAHIADRLAIPPHLVGVVGTGDADFALAVAEALVLLEAGQQPTMFFNEFSLREIHTRGLLMTGRVPAAVALADGAAQADSGLAIAPQWRVINQVTIGDILLADGDVTGTLDTLQAAMAAAETYRLPHQIQRAMRTLRSVPSDAGRALAEAGTAALARLRRLLAAPTASQ